MRRQIWLPVATILRRIFDELLPAEGTSRVLSARDLNLFTVGPKAVACEKRISRISQDPLTVSAANEPKQ